MPKEDLSHERILITGNAGALGRFLTLRLLAIKKYEIYGIDKREFLHKPELLNQFRLDLRRKSAFLEIKKINPEVIIHLGVVKNPQAHRKKRENAYYFNLESTAQLLKLAENLNLEKFIYLSSANLYGPSASTSGLLTEEAPLHGANKSPEVRDLVSVDMMVQSLFWKKPQTKTIILRPCHIVGPHLKNAPSTYFRLEKIPYILGFDPVLQLIHEEEVIDGIFCALKSNARGIYNLAGKELAPLSFILKLLKKPTMGMPESILRLFMKGAFLGKRSNFPSSELDHLKYSCLVDDSLAKSDLSFSPKRDLYNTIKDFFPASNSV